MKGYLGFLGLGPMAHAAITKRGSWLFSESFAPLNLKLFNAPLVPTAPLLHPAEEGVGQALRVSVPELCWFSAAAGAQLKLRRSYRDTGTCSGFCDVYIEKYTLN